MQQSQVAPIDAVPASILTSMQEFQTYNRLKKAALTAVAYHLNNVLSYFIYSFYKYLKYSNIFYTISLTLLTNPLHIDYDYFMVYYYFMIRTI